MARNIAKRAKRANRNNPREDRNRLPGFITGKASNFHPQYARHDEQLDTLGDCKVLKLTRKVELLPRNIAQEDYIDNLNDERKYIVCAMGPAGCGKTLLATKYALRGYLNGDFKKIVVTRPAVSVDEQHGFLPGSLIQKMEPWVMPILDVFKEHMSPQDVQKMIANEALEIAPLAYMRGRTFKDSIIIFDEAQNSTISQTKMVLTRIGENSRMIVTGDLHQHDRGYETNGLKDIIERLSYRGSKHISVIRFEPQDVERHPVIEEILGLYDDE